MKRFFSISLFLFLSALMSAQGVKVSESSGSPDPSAILETESSSQGFLPPRMTTAERDAIGSPATGLIIFNTETGCPNYYSSGTWHEWCAGGNTGSPAGSITSLGCDEAIHFGTLTMWVEANGASVLYAYTGGNGGSHNGQSVSSTGVTGLTATLAPGNFASGAGILMYSITGTPSASGTAYFALDIGGQTCTLERNVKFLCGSSVTFTYKGSPVTYGTVAGANSACWLDRNLGASQVATSVSDASAYGDLFQWGRGDDGHQNRNSSTTNTQSGSDSPGHGNFILGSSDWRNPSNNNLWQGVNGINNPCPAGWRPPSEVEWEAERTQWSSNNSSGAFNSSLKLTNAGYRERSDAVIYNTANRGYYCSYTIMDGNNYGMFLSFTSGGASMSGDGRADAHSVRCIKD